MLKQWSSVTEAVTIFLYATLAIEGNTPHHQIISTKHMCVCVKQTGKVFTVSMAFSAKKLPLYPNWWSYHRFTKACWHSRLLHSFPASVSGSCVCAQGINIQEMAACLYVWVFAGMYIPSCDEDGYYRKVQCDQSRGECWCADQHGGEMMGTRIHGNPNCGKRMANKYFQSPSLEVVFCLNP